MITIASVDEFLAQHGQFNLLDWLLENGYLTYGDYEHWRYGKQLVLCESLSISEDELVEIAKIAVTNCKKLRLCMENQYYFSWDGDRQKYLKFSYNSELQEIFCKQWMRAQDLPQLDLFMDNSAIITENKLCDALANRQISSAEKLIKELAILNPNNSKLGDYQSLLLYSQHLQNSAPIAPDNIASELAGLEDEVMPLAHKLLQRGARDYLAVAWRRLAGNLDSSSYDSSQPKLHTSYLLAQIPDWQAVTQQLLYQELTFKHCEFILRLAEGFQFLNDHPKSQFCWVLAFERFPKEASHAIEKLMPVSVLRLWESFCDLNDTWPDVFFSGFILASDPALINQAGYFPGFSLSSTELIADLMIKKLAREDEISARQNIQNFSPALLRMVMSVQISR
jgi:hypothetical protein